MTAARHLRLSLVSLAVFLGAGLGLEALLGLRADAFMQDALRREFLRLGHAHGALLSLVNVALAWAMLQLRTPEPWASRIRLAALPGALLVGLGFAGGGLWHGPTDPGPLVLLAPAGALLLLPAIAAVALVRGQPSPGSPS
jgi:hypothetical protein